MNKYKIYLCGIFIASLATTGAVLIGRTLTNCEVSTKIILLVAGVCCYLVDIVFMLFIDKKIRKECSKRDKK